MRLTLAPNMTPAAAAFAMPSACGPLACAKRRGRAPLPVASAVRRATTKTMTASSTSSRP
jgi:hypothetical protein